MGQVLRKSGGSGWAGEVRLWRRVGVMGGSASEQGSGTLRDSTMPAALWEEELQRKPVAVGECEVGRRSARREPQGSSALSKEIDAAYHLGEASAH